MESGAASIRSRSIARRASRRQFTAPNWPDEVQQLGYEIRVAGRDGRWELDGYTREQVMAFSRRRQDIERTLAREGLAGAEAAQNIAHRTRLSKDHRDEESLKAEWRSRAQQYGIEVERHLSQSRERGPLQHRHPEKAEEAVRHSIDENIEREAVIDRRALEAKALQHAMGSVELDQIRVESQRFERERPADRGRRLCELAARRVHDAGDDRA